MSVVCSECAGNALVIFMVLWECPSRSVNNLIFITLAHTARSYLRVNLFLLFYLSVRQQPSQVKPNETIPYQTNNLTLSVASGSILKFYLTKRWLSSIWWMVQSFSQVDDQSCQQRSQLSHQGLANKIDSLGRRLGEPISPAVRRPISQNMATYNIDSSVIFISAVITHSHLNGIETLNGLLTNTFTS